MLHPVVEALRERPPGARVALVVEGGGMRGAVTGGMVLVQQLIRRRRWPVVDVHGLVEDRYEQLSPGLFAAVLRARTELHPIATDVATGEAADLHPHIAGERSLRLALRASATLPLLAGPPVELGGRRYLDAGLSAAIPFRAALADGATHVPVLRLDRDVRKVSEALDAGRRTLLDALA